MKEGEQAKLEMQGLMEMYQCGYLDGYKRGTRTKMTDLQTWKLLRDYCVKAFAKRFGSGLKDESKRRKKTWKKKQQKSK